MITIAEKIREISRRLEPVTGTPRLDTEILMASALGISRAQLLARLKDTIEMPGLEPLIQRRLEGEPIAYILGTWEFFSMTFKTKSPVLVPRPETEHLVETVLKYLQQHREAIPNPQALEIGTGSGCIALAIAKNFPGIRLMATDIAPEAYELAQENARIHRLTDVVSFHLGDLFEAVPAGTPPFDVICANPPYVEESAWYELSTTIQRYEDPGAILSGPDGLNHIRRIIAEAPAWLKPGGLLAFENGGNDQRDAIRNLLIEGGYRDIEFINDLAGISRTVACLK